MEEKIKRLKALFDEQTNINNRLTEIELEITSILKPSTTVKATAKVKVKKVISKTKAVVTVWNDKHPKCIDCGTTEKNHQSGGRCTTCYYRYNTEKKKNKPDAQPSDDHASTNMSQYKCEECSAMFRSKLEYQNVRCVCGSKKLLKLPR